MSTTIVADDATTKILDISETSDNSA